MIIFQLQCINVYKDITFKTRAKCTFHRYYLHDSNYFPYLACYSFGHSVLSSGVFIVDLIGNLPGTSNRILYSILCFHSISDDSKYLPSVNSPSQLIY